MMTAIVIGGGIAGCSTAYYLAREGVEVTLLESASQLAAGASGNPLAMLHPKISLKPDAQSALNLAGFDFTLSLIEQLSNKADLFDACGQVQLAPNAREADKQEKIAQIIDFIKKSQAELNQISGIKLKQNGIFLPRAGWLKPGLLCQTLTQQPNIAVLTNQTAQRIQASQNGWQVSTQNQTFQADNVVICNANDVTQFGFCASARITPVRGQVNWFAASAASQALKTIVCSDHYLSPAVDGMHSIGSTYTPNSVDTSIQIQDTQANLNALKRISPDIFAQLSAQQTSARAALRSQTLDYLPLAGQVLNEEKLGATPPRYNAQPETLPWLQGLFINAGHGSKGMITAPICAKLIASLIAQNTPPVDATLASKLNPSRFALRELGLKQLANSLYK